jgi:hypothetical protein
MNYNSNSSITSNPIIKNSNSKSKTILNKNTSPLKTTFGKTKFNSNNKSSSKKVKGKYALNKSCDEDDEIKVSKSKKYNQKQLREIAERLSGNKPRKCKDKEIFDSNSPSKIKRRPLNQS